MTSTAPIGETSAAAAASIGAKHAARSERLGLPTLGLYGMGAIVENMTALGLNTLLLFYLTAVCGLSGSQAGLALGLALVVDAVVDPMVGSISDASRSRHGRRHPFMLLAPIPIAIAFGLLFSVPEWLTGWPLFFYVLAAVLATRVGLSFFILPFNALGAEMTDDYRERSTVVAARILLGVLAGAISAFLAFGIFLKSGQTFRPGYAPFAWTCGAIAVAGGLISTIGTLGVRGRLHEAAGQEVSFRRFLGELGEVFGNPSFRVLFSTCLIFFIASGVAGALTQHANTFFWKLGPKQLLELALISTAGLFVGVFLTAALARFMEKKTMAIIGLVVIGFCQLGPVTLQMAGLVPPGGAMLVLGWAVILAGLGASAALIGFQSMMADAADEHEHLFYARREGLYFAGISFSVKASSGIGALIAGVALDLIGFTHALDEYKLHHVPIPPDTIRNLGITYGPGAALMTVVAVIILFSYRLGKAEHAAIREALDRRREGAS